MSDNQCAIKVKAKNDGSVKLTPTSLKFFGCATITWEAGNKETHVDDIAIRASTDFDLPTFVKRTDGSSLYLDVYSAPANGLWTYLLMVNGTWYSTFGSDDDVGEEEEEPELINGTPS